MGDPINPLRTGAPFIEKQGARQKMVIRTAAVLNQMQLLFGILIADGAGCQNAAADSSICSV